MSFNRPRRKVVKGCKSGRRNQRLGRFIAFAIGRPELPRRPFQLPSQYTDVPRRIECHRHPIARDSADLQNDIVPDVYPFADFTTEHQHDL
jgi:hypothetical protein